MSDVKWEYKAAENVISDLDGRRGIDIGGFDEDIVEEITQTLTDIILKASPEPPESDSFAELISVSSILRHRIDQMLKAIDAGSIDSEEIDLGDGNQPHRWHEEWAHGTRDILQKLGEPNE